MRLLHTADWHLGKLLKGVDRTPEIAAALRDLLGLVRSERVDLVVVSGDLFDRPQVSAEAEACAVEFFMELKALGVPALVIAGNHDPKERTRALAPFSGLRGPGSGAASSSPRREGGGGGRGAGGASALRFRAPPRPAPLPGGRGPAPHLRRGPAPGAGQPQSPLLLGHFAVEGARPGGGEFVFHLVGSYAVPRASLPLEVRYLALGHVHRQQQVSEAPVAWYPGSLVQLDFGEGEGAERGALLVELPPRGRPGSTPSRGGGEAPQDLPPAARGAGREDGRVGALSRLPAPGGGGEAFPQVKENLFRALPHLLAVEGAPLQAGEGRREEVQDLGFVEGYARYLEERGRKEEALLERFAEVLAEVEGEALTA